MSLTVLPFAVILLTFLLTMEADVCLCLSCLSSLAKPVDWFVMYKVPRATRTMPTKTTGKEFYYLDSVQPFLSYKNVNIKKKPGNPLFQTLQQIYDGIPREYAMYNDQPPTRETDQSTRDRKSFHPENHTVSSQWTTYAHMKGVYAFDDVTGFWIISSVPEFPAPRKQNYSYGDRQLVEAQSILCVTLPRKYLSEMERVFSLTKPKFYDGKIPTMRTTDPHNSPTSSIVLPVTSKGGQTFRLYAKSASFGKDLYDSLVAPDLTDDLFVETWRPNLKSNCSTTYKVQNVKTVGFDNGYSFSETIDHAKWAVTENSPWTCIGDINRAAHGGCDRSAEDAYSSMAPDPAFAFVEGPCCPTLDFTSQFKRGGGTMCLRHEDVSHQFRKLVKDFQKCN